MEKEIKAVGEWVLIAYEPDKMSKGGIILPNGASAQHSAVDAKVLDIGPDVFDPEGPVKSEQFKVGDTVKIHRQLLLKVTDTIFFVKPNGVLGVVK